MESDEKARLKTICTDCGGTGAIGTKVVRDAGGWEEAVPIRCPQCNGQGAYYRRRATAPIKLMDRSNCIAPIRVERERR